MQKQERKKQSLSTCDVPGNELEAVQKITALNINTEWELALKMLA